MPARVVGVVRIKAQCASPIASHVASRSASAADQAVRTGNRVDAASGQAADPRDGCPIVETRHKLTTKIHLPGPTHHNAHKIGSIFQRHEVDNCRAAGLGLKFGFEDEGAGTIPPPRCERRLFRSN